MNKVSIAVVALGGYGLVYLEGLLDKPQDDNYEIVGGVDPEPERCTRLQDLKNLNIPIYSSLEEFYENHSADLVILSSPIHLHVPQTVLALSKGSNVLCEKPLGATIQEAREMINAEKASPHFAAIGYQWSFTDAIQSLKKDILDGVLGKPKLLKTIALWPRNESYYNRNNWAGGKRDSRGNWILDSPANNAVAHYLHNMFYVLGPDRESSAVPVSVEAELYRANKIDNFDTVASRIITDNGVKVLFYGAHPVDKPKEYGPFVSYEFENATVTFDGLFSDFKAVFKDGSVKNYGKPDEQQIKKMWDCISAVRTGEPVACASQAASSQTLCINGMQDSTPEIITFPEELVKVKGEPGTRLTYVEGLVEDFINCYEKNILPNEAGISWSKKPAKIDLTNYQKFPSV